MKKNTGEYWDFRLTVSPENPYPLAPCNLIEQGLVNERNYYLEGGQYGLWISRMMLDELDTLDPAEIQIAGIGFATRDLLWIQPAIKNGFGVNMWDISGVACQNARRLLSHFPFAGLARITQDNVMVGFDSGQIDKLGTIFCAFQFIEHQGEAMPDLMRHLGRFLQRRGRRGYLVIPRLEDNPPKKVKWNSAVPPRDRDWQAPLNEGFGGKVKICVLGKHIFFPIPGRFIGRKYTLYRLSA